MGDPTLTSRSYLPRWARPGTDATPILIERTAKRWKALLAIATVLGWLGLALLVWRLWADFYAPLASGGAEFSLAGWRAALVAPGGIAGILCLGFAFVVGVYARFMAWWRHG